jgi:hypothetical protein
MAKRSRCFIVAPAKMSIPNETHGQVEVGSRFFEGAAAGAVMIGQAPDSEAFHSHFNWAEAVISVNPDGSDVEKVLKLIAANPEHFAEVGRRNVVESLLRHDWVYRWRQILTLAGLQPAQLLLERERLLSELALSVTNKVNQERKSLALRIPSSGLNGAYSR